MTISLIAQFDRIADSRMDVADGNSVTEPKNMVGARITAH
jgi:hypothetical protein